MASRFLRLFAGMEIEERILNAGSLLAIIGVFLPWLSGEWLGGDAVVYSGLRFYTSMLGVSILLLHLLLLSFTIIPLVGGPILLRRRFREGVRLFVSLQATVITLAALSVLTKVTFEFSRMEIRFGIYLSLVGSIIATLYAFLRLQELKKIQVHEHFRHPEDDPPPEEEPIPHHPMTPPPPPPPPEPEEHHLHP